MTAVTIDPGDRGDGERHAERVRDGEHEAPGRRGDGVERADVHDRDRQTHEHIAQDAAAHRRADADEHRGHQGQPERERLARAEGAEHPDHDRIQPDDDAVEPLRSGAASSIPTSAAPVAVSRYQLLCSVLSG